MRLSGTERVGIAVVPGQGPMDIGAGAAPFHSVGVAEVDAGCTLRTVPTPAGNIRRSAVRRARRMATRSWRTRARLPARPSHARPGSRSWTHLDPARPFGSHTAPAGGSHSLHEHLRTTEVSPQSKGSEPAQGKHQLLPGLTRQRVSPRDQRALRYGLGHKTVWEGVYARPRQRRIPQAVIIDVARQAPRLSDRPPRSALDARLVQRRRPEP